MKTGINVGVEGKPFPDAVDLPVQVARFQAKEPPPFVWVMPPFVRALKAAGKTGLARFNWVTLTPWVRDWAKNVDVELHEYGNEPAPETWNLYRARVAVDAPLLHDAGRKVILAAARTNLTEDWLGTTPDSVWESVDGVALHPYDKTAAGVLEKVQQARQWVPSELPLFVTEFGWSVDTDPQWANHPLVVATEHNQAEKITAAFGLLRDHADELKLKLASVFMYQDFPINWRWWRFAGVVHEDGEHKDAYKAVAAATATAIRSEHGTK